VGPGLVKQRGAVGVGILGKGTRHEEKQRDHSQHDHAAGPVVVERVTEGHLGVLFWGSQPVHAAPVAMTKESERLRATVYNDAQRARSWASASRNASVTTHPTTAITSSIPAADLVIGNVG
jgi:hypothetical protein